MDIKDAEFIETYEVHDVLGPFHVNNNEVAEVICSNVGISISTINSMVIGLTVCVMYAVRMEKT